MYISEIVTTVPENVSERVPLEQKVYKVFDKLGIPFERVDNDPGHLPWKSVGISVKFLAHRCGKMCFVQPGKKTTFSFL